MVPFPSEWVQQFGYNVVTAYPPESGARFRYYERIRPCPSFAQLVDRVLAQDPAFRVHQLGTVERIVTGEGEYGAWLRVDGHRDGARAVRFIGAVFTEEFATLLDCVAMRPRHFGELASRSRALLVGSELRLGARPRRFYYVPPAGWQALVSGVTANWYPPDFPNNLSTIAVLAAERITTSATRALHDSSEQLAAGLAIESTTREDIVVNGRSGTLVRLHGKREGRAEPIFRELAMFVVDDVSYRMRLETTMALRIRELRDTFSAMTSSFRPLPTSEETRTGNAFATPTRIFDHWVS